MQQQIIPSANIDPAAIMRIKDLQLRARAVVEGFHNGLHRSPYHGFSVEFSEYRPYSTGDDPRTLDWKLYARSDRYFVKRFEDETNRRCYLVVDQSRSMAFGSLAYTKADYARTLAATLAYYFSLQRDGVGLLTFGEQIDQYLPSRHRPGHLKQLMSSLMKSVAGKGTDLGLPLEHLAKLVAKRGLVILISDMLVPLDTLQSKLSLLRSRQHEVMILCTLDPQEVTLNWEATGIVVDMESDREIYIDPDAVRSDYQQRFQSHFDQLRLICDRLGIDLFMSQTDRSLESSLYDILSAQQHRGRVTSRRRGAN